MAASSTPINGTAYYIEISTDSGTTYDTIGYAKNLKLNVSHSVRDITSNSSSGWEQVAEGLRSWSLSGDGLVTYNTESNVSKPNDLYDLISTRTEILIRFTTANTGDYQYSGSAWLETYDQEGSTEETISYSFSFRGTGALTQAAVA